MLCINKKCGTDLPEFAVFCLICGKKQQPEPRKRVKRPNGSGTAYKLAGRRRRPWVAAKAGVIIGYYETKTEALDTVNGLTKKSISERYNMTFKEVFAAWKLERYRDLTEKGKEGYEIAYKHFEALYDSKFRELRTEHYQKEVDKFVAKGRSHSSANKLKQLIGQMSKYAMREEIITTNYAQFIKLPANIATEKKTFTKGDIKKLESSHDDAAKLILMLIYTGMRIGELFALQTANVFNNYCIGGEKTEAGKNRVIPIPPEVRKHFVYFKNKAGGKDLLIEGYEGNREIDNFRNRDYYGALETLGIRKLTPHCTRHTYATMAKESGMEREDLQKILGHAQYSTTADIYIHADVEKLVKAAENLTNKKEKPAKKKAKDR